MLTRQFIEDFLVVPNSEDQMKAISEIDNSWNKYGVPNEVFCGTHWKIFFAEEKHLENAINWLKKNGIAYKRCKVKI